MIEKLHSKGLIIDDIQLSISILKSRGYYNLVNRYKEEFYNAGTKTYRENVHLTDLYYYHRVEDDLRNILFKFTINFEQRLKEALAYILAKKFGVKTEDYLNPTNYRRKNKAISITNFLKANIDTCNDDPTKYYKKEYNQVPPWILLSNTSLGQTRMLLSIFPRQMTEYVAGELLPVHKLESYKEPQPYFFIKEFIFDEYIDRDDIDDKQINELIDSGVRDLLELTRNMITIIYNFRNNLAHGSRLIHFKASQKLNLKSLRLFANEAVFSDKEFLNNNLCRNELFAFMSSLVILLDKYDSKYFIEQLASWEKINTSTEIEKENFSKFITSCGLPNNFVTRLRNIKIEKTIQEQNQDFYKLF